MKEICLLDVSGKILPNLTRGLCLPPDAKPGKHYQRGGRPAHKARLTGGLATLKNGGCLISSSIQDLT